MNDDFPIRIVLLVVAIVQNGAAFHFLRKSNASSTIFRRRSEGVPLSVGISLFFAAYCVAVATYLINPTWMAWSALPIPILFRWAGVVPLLLGLAWIIWGAGHIGENYTLSIETKEQHELITSGPYCWVRHPLYAGLLHGSIGVSLLTANWSVAITAAVTWTLLAYRTCKEEKNLIERFGDEYRDYMKRVGRFFPKLAR